MGRPLRIKQDIDPYIITTKTNNGEHLISDDPETREIFMKVFAEAQKKYNVKIFHFVIMSNHYHLELQTEGENIDKVMQYINSMLARLLNKKLGRKGHFWGSRYYATIVRGESYRFTGMKYIYLNPVRANMVKKPEEYALSSYPYYAFGKELEIPITRDEIFDTFGNTDEERQKNFINFIMEQIKEDEIEKMRQNLRKRFIGPDDFVAEMKEKYKTKRSAA